MHIAKVLLLLVQVGLDVMAHQREEGRNRKGFVAVAYDLEVDGVPVETNHEEGRCRVDGDHEEDAHYLFLFVGHCVVCCVHHD